LGFIRVYYKQKTEGGRETDWEREKDRVQIDIDKKLTF
jgi:hypothetical protein